MTEIRQNMTAGVRWRLLLALLCVLLVGVSGTVQVAHTHTDAVAHADCSLCATALVAAQVADVPVIALAAQVATSPVPALPVAAPHAESPFALFTRPPPAV